MRFNRVDLPQPLAPTSVTISLSCTARLTSSSAVTTESPASNRLVTDARSILATERLLLVPGEQSIANDNNKPIAQEAEQPDAEHRRDDDVVAVKQIRIVQQVAEPAPDRENLRDHHQHPGDAHGQPDAGHDRRQRGGQDDAHEKLAFVGAHHPRDLVQRDVDLADAMRGIDGRREKRTETDQEYGRRVADAEEDQRQGHPSRHRDVAQDLDGRIEDALHGARKADQQTDKNSERDAPTEAGKNAPRARPGMVEPGARISRRHIGRARHQIIPDRENRRRRRKNVAPHEAGFAANLPQQDDRRRKYRVLQDDGCAPRRRLPVLDPGELSLRRCRLLLHHHVDSSAADRPDAFATNDMSMKLSTFGPKSSLTQPSWCSSLAIVLMSATLVRKSYRRNSRSCMTMTGSGSREYFLSNSICLSGCPMNILMASTCALTIRCTSAGFSLISLSVTMNPTSCLPKFPPNRCRNRTASPLLMEIAPKADSVIAISTSAASSARGWFGNGMLAI